jgi:hypothetical protein
MEGILRMVEDDSTDTSNAHNSSSLTTANNTPQMWSTIQLAPRKDGIPTYTFTGRFMPANEINVDDIEEKLADRNSSNFEEWMTHTSTLLIQTEINVQLGIRLFVSLFAFINSSASDELILMNFPDC